MSDVLVVVGPAGAPWRKADLSAVGCGLEIASSTGGSVDVLLLGADASAAVSSDEVSSLGVRTAFHASGDAIASYTAEGYATAVRAVLDAKGDGAYRVVVAATSSASKEFLPRLAALVDAPMASDVLAIDEITADSAKFTRAVFVGNLLASVELRAPTVLVTCRASEFAVPDGSGSAASVEDAAIDVDASATLGKRSLALHQVESERPDLKEADTVVSVGRGTRGPEEGIPLCEKLADSLGAAVGATRAVVDAGWLPNEYQVGQTGKIVAPELYLAIGLSGSIQHLAGMRNSKTIVAINKDPEAPIFDVADLGLVADLFVAVPALTEAIEKRRS